MGLAVGAFLGLFHLGWAVLVALGWAQALMDFVLSLHMVHLSYVVGPFDLGMAAGLVAFTAVVGYVGGYIAALLWNWTHK